MRIVATAFLWLALLCIAAHAQDTGPSWFGAEIKDLTQAEADALGWELPRGAKLVKAIPGAPAELAGLVPDDILVSVDGLEIANVKAFIETVSRKAPGTEIRLAILRAGREKRLPLRLAARPAQFMAAKASSNGPLPMLDTGGHMAQIKAIALTPDGKQLVTASIDKTIRLWDMATGRPLRTIRGEAAPGDPGKLYTIALSPDGRWLAVGGWTHSQCPGLCGEVRLYDFASGKLAALLEGHNNTIFSLAFSPDSKLLISGSFDDSAIIWDVASRQALHRLKGHRDHVYGVAFTPDGTKAVTGSFDHDLRLWRVADGELLKIMTGHTDKITALAVAPDGRIASGDLAGEIRLWDAGAGDFLKTLVWQPTAIGSLSFSPNGKRLLSGLGTSKVPTDEKRLQKIIEAYQKGTFFASYVYDTTSGRETVTYTGHNNIVAATAISPDGRWGVTAGGDDHAIHIWDLETGIRRKDSNGQPLTLSGTGRAIWAGGFSRDGQQIAWGTENKIKTVNDRGPLLQALNLPLADKVLTGAQALNSTSAETFQRAITGHDRWTLSDKRGGAFGFESAVLEIMEGGKLQSAIERGDKDGYVHRSYTFTVDGQTVISGGDGGELAVYDRTGKKLGRFIGNEGDVMTVAPSPDGRFLLSGSTDQTVRLWNIKTRELLVSLFKGSDDEWVMWTPQGFYASSPAGARLIGWQINHGPDHEAEYVTAAQLRQHLNRPDIVARAIQLVSAEAAVMEAHGANFTIEALLAKPVPRLHILSPSIDAALKGGNAQVAIALEATPDPVKVIRIQVNGQQIAEKLPEEGSRGIAPGNYVYEVPLEKGANKIAIAAVNDTGETVASVRVLHDGEGYLDKRGTLYILAIGVDKYPNLPGKDLRYAGADAKAFTEAMEKRAGRLHERVVKRLLINGASPSDAPTAANIVDALDMLRSAKENDTVMLFVSGHGINDGPNYRFAPTDAAWGVQSILRQSSAVPWYAFQEALIGANGRRMLFLDTCHAGNAFNQRLLSDSYEANIMVYASARSDQEALEDATLGGGHGLFTYALVEGVNGGARDVSGEVRTDGLRDFVKSRVAELAAKTAHSQEPQYFRARDAKNYLLARPQ